MGESAGPNGAAERLIANRLGAIRSRIARVATVAGRDPNGIRLVAVSKGQPAAIIRAGYGAGQRDFGENYAQELRDKMRDLADLPELRWHFIGPLQRNKVKYCVAARACVHTIDRMELADELARRCREAGFEPEVLIQVNVGGEAQKSGVGVAEAGALIDAVRGVPGLSLVGLMSIVPDADNAEESRPHFERLAELARCHGLRELSMGMSHDLDVAIAAGATMVRVGTAIFGARKVALTMPS